VALVDLAADGSVSDVELRSDDVSPSRAETSFGQCMERALRAWTYERPTGTPAVIEIAFEYARTVPDAHRPGGAGVRRGARARAQHHAQGTGLPPERVREVAGQHAAEIERCVHDSVVGSQPLAGRLELEMTVLADGTVEEVHVVSSTTNNAGFDQCVTTNARTWLFPAPGARLAIRYPLVIASEVAPR
jgi:outer membrane biosynthesis protein TonB